MVNKNLFIGEKSEKKVSPKTYLIDRHFFDDDTQKRMNAISQKTKERSLIEVLKKSEVNFLVKSLIKNLEKTEEELDIMNVTNGSEGNLCIFCNSGEWNTKVGIVHDERPNNKCLILELRNQIKELKRLLDEM